MVSTSTTGAPAEAPPPTSPPSDDHDDRAEGMAFGWAAFFVALLALIVAIVAVGLTFSLSNDDDSSGPTYSGPPKVVSVSLTEMAIAPKSLEVAAGQPLRITVTNDGAAAHDLWLPNGDHTDMLEPGETATLESDGLDESGEAYCNVPGHRAAGMVMAVTVTGGGSGEPDGGSGGEPTDDAATIDFAAKADEAFEPYDPTAPPTPGATEHRITLAMTEEQIEIGPGVTQKLWTFGGTVPGTPLRGKVGDTFVVTIVNEGTIEHSIDFHASKVAWNDEMRSIAPGESLEYTFVAKHAGVYMYHCGTAPALHHIGNGMFGAIIIDPPNLPAVDHEYLLVQSEYYVGPEGAEGDLTKMQNDAWDAVVMNGYVNQYRDRPIRVEPDERVRVWVLDAGPSENSAFHIVGTIFDTTWKEGSYLLQPDDQQGGSQVLDLQPAQGGFVEFSFDEAGLYPIVTHKFSNVGKGVLGLFQAGEVDGAGGGH